MELEDHLFFLCTQVTTRRDRALADVLRPLGLLSTEWRVLGTLRIKGAMTMLELAQWTAYERTRLSKLLNNMQERGWLERYDNENDKRSVLIEIAPLGTALHRKAEKKVDSLNHEILQAFTDAEIELVRSTLRAIRQTLIVQGY